MLAMGNEIGSHSTTHPQFTDYLLPEVVTEALLADREAKYSAALNGAPACAAPYCLREDANAAVVTQLRNLTAAQWNQIYLEAKAVADPTTLDAVHLAVLEASFYFQFGRSQEVLAQQLGIPLTGAAVPGMPEKLPTSLEILQYYEYLSGGYSSVGAGYPGAFGYITPGVQDKIYLAPNMSFDFTLIGFQGKTPQQALDAWMAEFAGLRLHGDASIILWPWHDYGPTQWILDEGQTTSPYTLEMFTDFIAAAYAAGVEFVRLDDLAKRMEFDGEGADQLHRGGQRRHRDGELR